MRVRHRSRSRASSRDRATNGFIRYKVLYIIARCKALIQGFIDVHDQPAIVRQYMRYTAQIGSPESLPHHVRRALQMYAPRLSIRALLTWLT